MSPACFRPVFDEKDRLWLNDRAFGVPADVQAAVNRGAGVRYAPAPLFSKKSPADDLTCRLNLHFQPLAILTNRPSVSVVPAGF